jgi:signal transduction histidine kinase
MTSLWSLPFIFTTAAYLTLGVWVIAQRKNAVQRLYGSLCLGTALWQGIWAILFSGQAQSDVYVALRVCYTGIVFIPAILYHFIEKFTGQERYPRMVALTYGVAGFMAALIWQGNAFLNGFHVFSWGMAAKAGSLHPIFAVLVTAVIVRSLVLLNRMPAADGVQSRQVSLVRWATYVYCGGALDLLSNYGWSLFPTSFIFSGIALMLFGYAMLRYEFLAVALPRESDEERLRREAAGAEMRRLGMTAAFPLVSQGELLGYMLLGEKMSEEAYSKEDLLLLRIVANQAALAYQRVRYLELAVHGARTEMLGEIAGGFAHEIKTPLANISLPAELCFMDLTDVEKGKRTIEEVLPELKARMKDIMTQAFKASEKIEAVRQFSKPGQIRMETVSLPTIFENSLGLLSHLLRKADIQVRVQAPTSIPAIRGDAKQLEIVFVNLIKNAAEAMASQPSKALARELILMGREDGDWIVASVKDSGPGIKRTDFGHLFEAYFTTKGSEGTGMGLFLSQQVIKAHGGSIEVKSQEGLGTEFVIRLPKFMRQENVHQAA